MGVLIPDQVAEAIRAHTVACLPEEACGLLAMEGETIRFVYPLTNKDRSPVAFTVEPREHFRALRHAERHGWEIAGAFHSHPASEAVPSATDVRLAPSPDWLHLVSGFDEDGRVHIRAFSIRDGAVTERSVGEG